MAPIAQTRSGAVGGIDADGVSVFRGIPYATPPVGDRRYRPPVPEARWEGVRPAVEFGPRAVQGQMLLEQLMGGGPRPESEDCLYLNVFTPGLDDAKRPVMVWIHGGAFVFGEAATPWYDGSNLARRGDVVVVTVNYRLGALGFLHLQDLFGDDFAGSGNLGLADQVAALGWVRDNIAAFGGDPDRVTVFGESAGGASVGTLLGAPSARGLFTGAIAQSGAAAWCSEASEATDIARELISHLGVKPGDGDALRAAPAAALVAAQQAIGGELNLERITRTRVLSFQPVHDGVFLPQRPLDAVAAGSAAGVRLMLGTNADEMTLFALMDPALATMDHASVGRRLSQVVGEAAAQEITDDYLNHRPDLSSGELWTVMATDVAFRIPAIRLAEAHLAHGPVWMYLFTWATPVFGGMLKSTHVLEVPFVFDNLHGFGTEILTGTGAEQDALAQATATAWLAFARQGDPGWAPYSLERRATMRIDNEWEVIDDPQGQQRKLWDGRW